MSTTIRTMPYEFPHYKPRTMPVTTLRYGGRRRDQQQQRLARGLIADTRATRPTKPLTQGHLAIAAAQISSRSAHGVDAELLAVAPLLSSALAGRSTGAARVGNAPAATVLNPAQRSRNISVRPANPRVSVVIPTLNEEDNIGWALRRLPQNVHEIILVDGRSRDHTVAVARRVRPDVRVLEQHVAGKGAALALGLISATGDIVVMIDADGSMDPAEIPGLLGALLSGADVVKGSRESAGGGSHDLSLLRKTGNRALTFVTNSLYRQHWSELCYGYAAFWADIIPTLDLAPLTKPAGPAAPGKAAKLGYGQGFEIEALLFCRSTRAALRVAEVFSFEHERRYGESNLVTWRDGRRVLAAVLREWRWAPTLQLPARHLRAYPLTPHLHAAPSPTVESPAHCSGPAHRDVAETAFEPALPEDRVLIPLHADAASSGGRNSWQQASNPDRGMT